MKHSRPPFIRHFSEICDAEPGRYSGSSELHGVGSSFGKAFGLKRLGIHHESLSPGRRTSYPHAESTEEEFIYVLEGCPDVWIDGELYPLKAGEAVGFPAGTGICHTFVNNTQTEVRLLVVGEASREDNQVYYPLNLERKERIGKRWWEEVPQHSTGHHDGLPDALREP